MSGKRRYRTVVLDARNEYILGRIAGVLNAITENYNDKTGYAICHMQSEQYPDAKIITVETTDRKYRKASRIIETLYPKHCEFDVDVVKFLGWV